MHAHLLFLTQRQFPGLSHQNSSPRASRLVRDPAFAQIPCSASPAFVTIDLYYYLATHRQVTRHTTAALSIAPRTPKYIHSVDTYVDHGLLTASPNAQQLKFSLDWTGAPRSVPAFGSTQIEISPCMIEGCCVDKCTSRSPFRRKLPSESALLPAGDLYVPLCSSRTAQIVAPGSHGKAT